MDNIEETSKDGDIGSIATCTGYIKIYLSFLDDLTNKKRKIPPEIALETVHNFMLNYLANIYQTPHHHQEEPNIFFIPHEGGEEA